MWPSRGTTLTEEGGVKGRWKEYTEQLYMRDPNITDAFLCDDDYKPEPNFLEVEVEQAVKEPC